MRAVIIAGGSVEDYDYIKSFIQKSDTVICADSGYNHAVKMGIRPRVIVGDLDSIGNIPKGVETLRYPEKKNLTDTEIALEWARERGFKEFLLLGATGTRMDHTLANIYMLKAMLDNGEYGEIVDEHNHITITDRGVAVDEPPGTIISLVPVTRCRGVTTENLEYELVGATLYQGRALGISNIITNRPAKITVRDGALLVIVAKD